MVDPNWVRHVLSQHPAWAKLASYKEVPIIAELLFPGDQILDVAFGLYEDHLGLVVITPNRILFGGRKAASLMKHTKTEVFELERVTSVQVNGSTLLSTLVIVTSGAKGEVKSMATPDCRRVADTIRGLMIRRLQHASAPPPPVYQAPPPPAAPPAVSPAAPPQASFVDELNKLSALHASGVLSDDEFARAKAKLLS